MNSETADFFENWPAERQAIREKTPDISKGFGTFYQTVMKEGALTVREKELISFAIGLALRCGPCLRLHIQGCLKAGATREQVLEAAGVTVMMQGGPAFTHLPEVLSALDYLSRPVES